MPKMKAPTDKDGSVANLGKHIIYSYEDCDERE